MQLYDFQYFQNFCLHKIKPLETLHVDRRKDNAAFSNGPEW